MTINKHTQGKLLGQLFISLILFFSYTLCNAGIYKWVDAEGNVHYSQERPPQGPAEKMDVQRHAPRDVSSYKRPGSKADEAKTEEGTEEKVTEEKQPETKPETKAEKKQRSAACAQARKSLATMESSGRIRSKDKDGNISYLSEQQKQERIK